MYLPVQIFIFYFLELCYACIPTQQVEPTTTTTPVPTTTATEPPFPCSVCQKVYDPACQGFGIPSLLNWCPKAAEVGVEYLLGAVAALPLLPQDLCSTTIICPPGTTPRINLLGFSDIAAPTPATLAYCRESGPLAGQWFTGISPLEIEMASLTCKNII
ncbi:unnamed protein product [Caenorhabditis nigoni]|uniref:Uncharacterized protein n=1 Tax=Caenorhabditis nigoni TaxID=1611254 RepID=A0A2G5SUT1_9PELO|nr:hypothetical protein B9Z55_024458 [Caenorhabditis nigoni]